jgi:hypothetical protein
MARVNDGAMRGGVDGTMILRMLAARRPDSY